MLVPCLGVTLSRVFEGVCECSRQQRCWKDSREGIAEAVEEIASGRASSNGCVSWPLEWRVRLSRG